MTDSYEGLPLVDSATASPDVKAALERFPQINLFRAMAGAAGIYPAFAEFISTLFHGLELPRDVARLVPMLVANTSACHYVWRQNSVAAKSVGITDEQISAVERSDLGANCLSAAQQVALKFVRESVENLKVSDETYQLAADQFTPRALAELLFLGGTYMLICRFVLGGRVQLDAKPAPSPYQ